MAGRSAVAEIAARLGDSIPTVMSIYAHELDAAGRGELFAAYE